MRQEDLDELKELVNEALSVENRIKALLIKDDKPMVLPDQPAKPEPKVYRCSKCGRGFKEGTNFTGHYDSPVRIQGLRNVASSGFRYIYCSMDCGSAISDAIMRAKSNDKPVRPYQTNVIRN
jgi:hypothetical protein